MPMARIAWILCKHDEAPIWISVQVIGLVWLVTLTARPRLKVENQGVPFNYH